MLTAVLVSVGHVTCALYGFTGAGHLLRAPWGTLAAAWTKPIRSVPSMREAALFLNMNLHNSILGISARALSCMSLMGQGW